MAHSFSKTIGVMAIAAFALGLAVFAATQERETIQRVPGETAAKITNSQLKGEVTYIQGDDLIAKMIPTGEYRLFHLRPGKRATIDGVDMPLNKVKPGTVLTAYVTVTEREMVERTITTVTGTVWFANPSTVILTLENRQNKQYDVPQGQQFNVDGQTLEARELRPGMKVTATKIVESPYIEVNEGNVVTGTTPKT